MEDEVSIRNSLASFLEDEGFNIFTASNGKDGINIILNNDVDCAIVDVRLPEMTGNDVIVRVCDEKPDMKFIIFTGSTNYYLPDTLLQLGIKNEDVLRKPITDLNVILELLKSKLE